MTFKGKIKSYVKRSEFLLHETKKRVLIRFLLVVAVFVLYFIFVSLRYGLNEGFIVTILTWSFFVFCTPIADAGFLLDFPVRLITKMRMIYSEMMVWFIGFMINAYAITFNPAVYERTEILRLFHHIIFNPIPFWAIIIVSAIGTFLSIYFGDELIDVAKHKHRKKYQRHKNKHRFLLMLFIIIFIILLYIYLIGKIGIKIPF